MTFMSLRLV